MGSDYRKLIDADTWAFIDRINAYYPPEAIDWPIERNRETYDLMSRAFHSGRPDSVAVEATGIAAIDHTVPVRVYGNTPSKDAAIVLYFHGGGFILGDLDSHDDICADLCAGTEYTVVSVGYRLPPEHTGTAAFDDATAAFDWAAAHFGRPVVLAGESAGGTLAACAAHHRRELPHAPIGQVLIYPMLGGDVHGGSYVTHAEAPLLSARDVAAYRNIRTGGADTSGDPRYLPLADTNFSGLPPTIVFTAECDPLSSDGETYRDRLLRSGGKARWIEETGLPHGYLRGRTMSSRAGRSFARIIDAVAALGRGEWEH